MNVKQAGASWRFRANRGPEIRLDLTWNDESNMTTTLILKILLSIDQLNLAIIAFVSALLKSCHSL